MTEDFVAGADWFAEMTKVFTVSEVRLLWCLKRARGGFVSREELHRAMTGQRYLGSNTLAVTLSRCRDRAKGFGLLICSERGNGYCMIEDTEKAA